MYKNKWMKPLKNCVLNIEGVEWVIRYVSIYISFNFCRKTLIFEAYIYLKKAL